MLTLERLCLCFSANAATVGDKVTVKAENPEDPSYVGQVMETKFDSAGHKLLKLRWYYRPEDSVSGRQVRRNERVMER